VWGGAYQLARILIGVHVLGTVESRQLIHDRELAPYACRVSYALTGYMPKPSILRQRKHSVYCRAEYR
jgi:hypothetical protein